MTDSPDRLNERAPTIDAGTIGSAAAGGAAWAYGSFVVAKALVFLTTIALARLLSPADFGIVGYALVIIGYLDLARDLGIGSALIARPSVSRRTASTAFYISVAWGAALAAMVFFAAPLLGDLLVDVRAVTVTQALSAGFLLSALASTHDALLYRELSFNRRVIPDLALALTKGGVSIALAISGAGFWSLVAGQIAGQAAFCLAAWVLQPFRPAFEWSASETRWLLGFGGAIVGSRLLTTLETTLGPLIIGSLLGPAALGVFSLAFTLPEVLLIYSFAVLSTVLFPVFSRLQSEGGELAGRFLASQRVLALFALPAGFGLAAIAPVFVDAVYGPAWTAAGPILQILAVRGALTSIGWNVADLVKSRGLARLQLVIALGPLLLLIPGTYFGAVSAGIEGVAWVYFLSALLAIAVNLTMAKIVAGISPARVLFSVLPGLFVGLVTAGAAFAASTLASSAEPGLVLVVSLAAGGLAYVASLWIAGRDLLEFVLSRIPVTGRLYAAHDVRRREEAVS